MRAMRAERNHVDNTMGNFPQSVFVVGAGPAGSLAAVRLARAGWTVTLAEQHRFPRDKVCGECLSAVGIAVLQRAGLDETLRRLGPVELTRTMLVGPDGASATHDLGRPMWGLTRRAMDIALLAAAAEAGVRVLQPSRVEGVTDAPVGRGSKRVRVRDEANVVSTYEADVVVVADGKSALLGEKPRATPDLGIKAHLRGVRADRRAIHLFSMPGFYGGLAAVEGDRWNLALSVPAERVRAARGDLAGLWEGCVRGSPWLAEAMGQARREGDFLASPLARFAVRRDWPAGVIAVGNAAAALEPIGGEGMGLALRSTELATEAMLGAPGGDVRRTDVAALQAAYDRLWRVRRGACRGVAVAMSSPTVARVMVRASEHFSAATRGVLGLMGK